RRQRRTAVFPYTTLFRSNAATVGGPAFTLLVNGTNFATDSTVRWNDSDRSTLFISSTQISASIPSTDIAISTVSKVTVWNPAPRSEEHTSELQSRFDLVC